MEKESLSRCYLYIKDGFIGGLANHFVFIHLAYKASLRMGCKLLVKHHHTAHGNPPYTLLQAVYERYGKAEQGVDKVNI